MVALISSATGAAASQTTQAHPLKPGGGGRLQPYGGVGACEKGRKAWVDWGKTWKGLRVGQRCGAEPSACPGWLGGNLDFSLCSPFPTRCCSAVWGTPNPVCAVPFLKHLMLFLQVLINQPRTAFLYQGMMGCATKLHSDAETTGQEDGVFEHD